MSRPWRGRGVLRDAAVAVVACAADLALSSNGFSASGEDGSVVAILFAVPAFAVLLVRLRAPVVVLGFELVHVVAAVLLLSDYRPTLAVLVALFTVAAHRGIRTSVAAAVATCSVTATLAAVDEMSRPLAPLETPSGVVRTIVGAMLVIDLAVWGVGRWSRSTRERAAAQAELAVLQRREAVASERAAIARDMHDTVSHAVTAVVLHAAGARRQLSRRPERAEVALDLIEQAAQRAMTELREMLVVLREPGVERRWLDLDATLEAARALGLSVEKRSTGTARAVPVDVADVAHRLVQESLTNTAKHAGPGSATTVGLRWEDDCLSVEVRDDGGGAPPTARRALSGGAGLEGARTRVTCLGGAFHADRTPDGGFAVCARLPTATTVEPAA